jgi:2,4-dienoyl-CoA reductase-like NADH-dependent reductase (Old Yellow Enzyme family)
LTAYPALFSPTEIGGLSVRNRVAHASIVTRFVRDGQATPELINYHHSRAVGGTGLIVAEPVAMVSTNRDPSRLRAYDGGGEDSLRRLAAAVESEDCRLLGQVQDPGRGRHEIGRNDAAIGVSALPDDLSWTVPHVLETAEIRQLLGEWARGCARLKAAGWSGVELSAGHGHLFHQFLSPWSNRREDEYGGDLEGRTRFMRELVAAIRAECGRPFIIGVKLPGDDGVTDSIDIDEARRIAEKMGGSGDIDYWTFVWGAHANSLWTHLPNAHGPRAPYLETIRSLRTADPSIPTGAISYITDPNEGEHALQEGIADLVFMGRPLITDPAFAEKARTGREAEIRYCVSCNTCWRSIIDGHRLECDNNPRVAAEDEADWKPARVKNARRVVVVGSGIAGLEAAWVAAARGHNVTLFSAADEVGGKTRLHAELPGGENLSSIYDYQFLTGKRHGVKYELGVRGEVDNVLALNPDVVLLATGARMRPPAFLPEEYVEEGFVPDLRELMQSMLGRNTQESGRILLFDCDHTEMTYAAAERLTELFEHVTIVTPRDRIASDCSLINRQEIYQRLYDRNVEIVTSCELRDVDGLEDARLNAVNIYNGAVTAIPDIAAITYSTARVPCDEMRAPLKEQGMDVQTIGDCHAPRSVLASTRQGYQVGNAL